MSNMANEYKRVWKHYNAFYRKPGEVDSIDCGVCGSACDVKRGEIGPTGFAGSMLGSKTQHDLFTCPHNDEQWHWETLAMVLELKNTCSPSLRAIVQQDIDDAVFDGLKK